ncbi:MAG: type VI secretion system ImpA family N-terminal domain-containing protein [Amphritea sp.]
MEYLLNPISDSALCGEYLKGNRTLYRGLRNSFNMAQSSFRQLIESPDATASEELQQANQANWAELARLCEETLTDTSKDVEVFCWLATAQLFSGAPLENLAAVLNAFTLTVDQYWDDLNPKPPVEKLKSEDDAGQRREWAEQRIKPLVQLIGDSQDSGLLYMPLQMIKLIGDIDYSRYYSAERNGQLEQLKADAQAVLPAEKQTVTEALQALGKILEALRTLETSIAENCQQDGASGLSFRFLKESIERLINALRYLVGDVLVPWPLDKVEEPVVDQSPQSAEVLESTAMETSPAPQAEMVMQTANTMVNLTGSGEIYNRDQAFQELRKIADFFQQTEPHSPVYMLLERAIRWGYLSLPELLNEMVGDNSGVMGRITQLAGLESIEKTAIPDAQISMQELMHKQQVAIGDTGAVQNQIPASQVVVDIPPEQVDRSAGNTAASENDTSASSAGIASFEW